MLSEIKNNNKAFTLMELVIVIIIIGVLILLALPKFKDFQRQAYLTQIKNDSKVLYNLSILEFEFNSKLPNNITLNKNKFIKLLKKNKEKEVFLNGDKLNSINEVSNSEKYHKIKEKYLKDKVGTYLVGDFILDEHFNVYYLPNNNTNNNINNNNDYLAKDIDFKFIKDKDAPNEYIVNKVIQKGYFKYIGNAEIVEIPKIIHGNKIKDYYKMFSLNNNEVLFDKKRNVKKIISNNKNVTNSSNMFLNTIIKELDMSEFNTSYITDMSFMFCNMFVKTNKGEILKEKIIGLENWDTSSVTDMSRMFSATKVLDLDLSSFNTSNVTNMESMFENSQVKKLDLSSFNTSHVTNMRKMFSYSNIIEIEFSEKFKTNNVINMEWMFGAMDKIEKLDLSSFDTSNVINLKYMFFNNNATIGYAKSIKDTKKFNESYGKPISLIFKVK